MLVWQTSLRELTTLGIKNAENLAIPSVRNDVSIEATTLFVKRYIFYNVKSNC